MTDPIWKANSIQNAWSKELMLTGDSPREMSPAYTVDAVNCGHEQEKYDNS